MKRKARMRWDDDRDMWILELWTDGDWRFSMSWRCIENDFVHDSALCKIAYLQELGYEVTVQC